MRRFRSNPLIAWLCLICFGLTNTLLAGGVSVCRDAHGGVRIEWGCSRNTSGECVTSCGGGAGNTSPDDRGAPHPCDDTPLDGVTQLVKAQPREVNAVLMPALVALPSLWIDTREQTSRLWPRTEPERPPEALKRIRAIVLLV